MSQEQQSCLRFSLEESIWFKKGQEVEELLSISLDPHITIQEQEQYVLIRGSLDLTGEYLPTSLREEEEDEFEAGGKFVQTVEKREKGEYEFVHRFPVDVTIPKNRIANLGDIDVFVESFDYIVPENACLKLNADLTITGIYGEQQAHTPLEAEYEREEEFEPLYRSSAVAEREEVEEAEEEVETEEEREEVYEYENYNEEGIAGYAEEEEDQDDEYQPFNLEGRTPPAEQEDEIPVQIQYDTQPPPSYEEVDYRKENVFQLPQHELSESSEEQPAEPKAAYTPPPAPKYKEQEVEEEESSSSSAVEAEMEEEEKEEKKKTKGKKKYESISLTDFFARKEEERGATLRVCIVQEGENLDYIAEKYDLTIPQLLRVNQLEANQDVYAGQVLYIPNSEFVFKG
ncbi:stage VI sporulation protein D [Rossellomorea vietnamensis]|uniref:stage VI sporulation protein D n=1 Tax=Rossellomorea vietnamensis TaxID=218284 RepID=UPI001E540DAA|nr:stage VI sporulation protein D [Rossellomorea vietnamensis]MCC5801374.1 stage VI sporulation protein D [Rossellomorea vietnamensis]